MTYLGIPPRTQAALAVQGSSTRQPLGWIFVEAFITGLATGLAIQISSSLAAGLGFRTDR